jgi:hypothetical protein
MSSTGYGVVLGLGPALWEGSRGGRVWSAMDDYRMGGTMGLAWEYPHGMAFGLLLYSGGPGDSAYCLLH